MLQFREVSLGNFREECEVEGLEGGDVRVDVQGGQQELVYIVVGLVGAWGVEESFIQIVVFGVQYRVSQFVYNIYLYFIYRIGIYRYKWNYSKIVVKLFRFR